MIVAIGQQKGGVGKSTLTIALGVEAHVRGLRTLLVDADEQATVRTWAALAAEDGQATPAVEAAGARELGGLLARSEDLDLVVIDLPPRSDAIARAALMAADLLLMPSSGDPADVWSIAATLRLLEAARELRPGLRAAMVLARTRPGTVIARQAREVLELDGVPVLRASLSLRVTYPESQAAGLGPTTYAPQSEAADETRRLLTEVLKLGGSPHGNPKARRSSPRR